MGSSKLVIASGVVMEQVGDDLLVFTPKYREAVKLSGSIADTLLAIQAGNPVDESSASVSDLTELGIIEAGGLSRRGLITAGAVGAGAGIAMLSMPAAVAASSPAPSQGSSGSGVQVSSATYEQQSGPGWVFTVQVSGLTGFPVTSDLTVTFNGTEYLVGLLGGPLGQIDWGRSVASSPAFNGDIPGSFTLDNEPFTAAFVPATP
jgi:hypothetical protein